MKKYISYGLVVVCCYFSFGCKKDQGPTVNEVVQDNLDGSGVNVYLSGIKVSNGVSLACYWRNDTLQVLDESVSLASDIFVDKSDVLVSGQHEGKPCYWRNGKRKMLDVAHEGQLTAIELSDNQVYAVGYIHEGALRTRGFLLRGDKITYLNSYSGYASDMDIKNKELYISGADDGKACYWKNGEKTILSERGETSAIDVTAENLYIVGDNRSNGSIHNGFWNSGKFESRDLLSQSIVKVKLREGKLYILGSQTLAVDKGGLNTSGFVEENGHMNWLSGENGASSTTVKDLFIHKSVSYVLGNTQSNNNSSLPTVCYWVNGKIHLLDAYGAIGTAIFVN